jgi:Uma2 family endonuclease
MTAQDLQPPQTYKLKVADYLALDERGAFQGLRTELIEGEIIVMNPQARPHMFVKDELAYRIRRALEALGSELFVGTEGSIAFDEGTLPQPDILLTSAPRGEGFVPLGSIALIVEVAATSLSYDLKRKLGLYARAAVPEYWVADVDGYVIPSAVGAGGRCLRPTAGGGSLGRVVDSATIAGLRVDTSGLA